MTDHQRPATVSGGIRTQHTVDDFLLRCEDCGLRIHRCEDSAGLRRIARDHARAKRHSVTVQSTTMSVYQPVGYEYR